MPVSRLLGAAPSLSGLASVPAARGSEAIAFNTGRAHGGAQCTLSHRVSAAGAGTAAALCLALSQRGRAPAPCAESTINILCRTYLD